jgi:AraC family transcriptional regulator, positive regulator of tynA and feaB
METPILPQVPSLLDLSSVDEERRAGVWVRTATSVFPGLSINGMPASVPVGQIRSVPMGGGSLWSVLSAPVQVSYAPANGADDPSASISLMLQLFGSMEVGQSRRACVLEAGDMCIVDERFPFHLNGQVSNEIVFVRMPRRAVLGRHPHLEHCSADLLEFDDPGTVLLREALYRTVQVASDLREDQRGSVLAAMVQLLGAATSFRSTSDADLSWRVRAALTFIEMNLGDCELTAEQVARAQGISRRRLDQIMRSALGAPVTAQIWNRRLDQASADLVDPQRLSRTVFQIAYGVGFEDAAHFSRAFKARFGSAPRDWRAMRASSPV